MSKGKYTSNHYFPGGHVSFRRGKNPMFRITNHPKHPLFVFSSWWLSHPTWNICNRQIGSFSPKKIGVKPHGNPPRYCCSKHPRRDPRIDRPVGPPVHRDVGPPNHHNDPKGRAPAMFPHHSLPGWNCQPIVVKLNQVVESFGRYLKGPSICIISTENLFKSRVLNQMNQVIAPSTGHFFHPTPKKETEISYTNSIIPKISTNSTIFLLLWV